MKKNDFKPIYVVGNSRSGTTIMSIILGQNQEIYSFRELHFFEQLWAKEDNHKVLSRNEAEHLGSRLLCIQREGYFYCKNPKNFLNESKNMLKNIQNNDLSPMGIYKTFVLYETRRNDKVYPCEQTPQNIYYIQEILENFPNARIINMVRDPRAILLSQKKKWKRLHLEKKAHKTETIRSWINYHPIVISKLWNAAIKTVLTFKYDTRVLTLRFEDLLQEPQKVLKRICEFLTVEYQEEMLDVSQVGSSNIPDNSEKRGLNSEVADHWKKNLNVMDIYWCQKINKAFMEKYEYDPITIKPTLLSFMVSAFVFIFKIPLAFLVNIKRTKNMISALKKRLV